MLLRLSAYPGTYAPVVPATYAQREFTVPQGASATATATAPVQQQYVAASPTANYYADYYSTIRRPIYAPYPA